MPRHLDTSSDSRVILVRWGVRALVMLGFAIAWWLRFTGDDDEFGSNVVDTMRWFAGR